MERICLVRKEEEEGTEERNADGVAAERLAGGYE